MDLLLTVHLQTHTKKFVFFYRYLLISYIKSTVRGGQFEHEYPQGPHFHNMTLNKSSWPKYDHSLTL